MSISNILSAAKAAKNVFACAVMASVGLFAQGAQEEGVVNPGPFVVFLLGAFAPPVPPLREPVLPHSAGECTVAPQMPPGGHNKKPVLIRVPVSGADDRIRTGDLRLTKALRYHLCHISDLV